MRKAMRPDRDGAAGAVPDVAQQAECLGGALSLAQQIYDGYTAHPDKVFFESFDEQMTYAQAYRAELVLARYFADECGLAVGDTVALSTPNIVAAPLVMAACQLAGLAVAMFSYRLERAEFERAAGLVEPALIVMSTPEGCAMARELCPQARVIAAGCPFAPVPLVNDIVAQGTVGRPDGFDHADADARVIVFSSGSTGEPKAIVNKMSSFALNGLALRRAFSIKQDDVLFVPVPINHVFGIVGLCATLAAGATFATTLRYAPDAACALIDEFSATIHLGVSTMFIRELRELERRPRSFASLRAGLVAGAGCPAQVIEEFEERFGCRIMQSYGMSETAATLTVTPLSMSAAERGKTVGECIDGAQVKLLEDTGEICCKSASMMLGVMCQGGRLDTCLDNEGWFHTGDVGEMDADGMLSIVGRLKDMVIRGGINIFPAEIEAAYAENPDVEACCVVGCPDDELGERTCLAVVLKPGAQPTARELRQWARGRIEKHKVPDYVIKMDAFPYLGNSKIDKQQLKQQVGGIIAAQRVAKPKG